MKLFSRNARFRARSKVGFGTATFLLLAATTAHSATVTNCTEADLRRAMEGGGLVTFVCDGNIVLASTITNLWDTVLDASGHQITISGGGVPAVGIFYVNSNHLTLINLTLEDGSSIFGGAMYNQAGSVALLSCTIRNNFATQEPWMPPLYQLRGGNGGAIYNLNGGVVAATNCVFAGNRASQQGGATVPFGIPAGPCYGGAIDNEGGQVALQSCVFRDNSVSGGAGCTLILNNLPVMGTSGQDGCGGAIFNSGTLIATLCTFEHNSAHGGSAAAQPNPAYAYSSPTGAAGASGGKAQGAAICNLGTATITASLFNANTAEAGIGGIAGPGQSYNSGQGWEVCGDGGVGGPGGDALGAALFDGGTTRLINCTLDSNQATGGSGGQGGHGGAVIGRYNCAGPGGRGGPGGTAISAIAVTTGAMLTNCTIAAHVSISGPGGAGGPGGIAGPVIGPPGLPGTNGAPGLAMRQGGLCNTLLASNSPANGSANLTDLGHNLSSDASCAFTDPTSINNRDPLLGPLGNNGGPTFTIPLLSGSPAIDSAAIIAGLATDQRGFPRPVAGAPDVGAYEFGSPAFLRLRPTGAQTIQLVSLGVANHSLILQTSSNVIAWTSVVTNQFATNGTWLFNDPTIAPAKFYRLKVD